MDDLKNKLFPLGEYSHSPKRQNVKRALTIIRDAAAKWTDRLSDEQTLTEHVEKLLDSRLEEILFNSLGLNMRDGRISRQQYDGGKSAISEVIVRMVDGAVQRWFGTKLEKFLHGVQPSQSTLKILKEEFRRTYENNLQSMMRKKAEEMAAADIKTILDVVGYNPDDFSAILKDIPDDPITFNYTFNNKGILSSCVIHGVVTINPDKTLSQNNIDYAGAEVWCVATLVTELNISRSNIVQIMVITDGQRWQPVRPQNWPPPPETSKLAYTPKVCDEVEYGHEQIFKYMNQIDLDLIKREIDKFMSDNNTPE